MPSQLVELLSSASYTLSEPADVRATLERICVCARKAVPGADFAGISHWHPDGRIETLAATDALVHEVDRVQEELHQGPLFTLSPGDPTSYSEDVEAELRWPGYSSRAFMLGSRSQLTVLLRHDDDGHLALSLHSGTKAAFTASTEPAELVASCARVALAHALDRDLLNQAIHHRESIGKAIGTVMERYDLTEDAGFRLLSRLSQDSNIKLRDLAAQVVASPNRDLPWLTHPAGTRARQRGLWGNSSDQADPTDRPTSTRNGVSPSHVGV